MYFGNNNEKKKNEGENSPDTSITTMLNIPLSHHPDHSGSSSLVI